MIHRSNKKIVHRRMLAMMGFFGLAMGVFVLRMVYLQLVHGQSYLQQAAGVTRYRFTVSAVRGRILDSEGAVLAGNKVSYDVMLNHLFVEEGGLNDLLKTTLTLLDNAETPWADDLPVTGEPAGGHFSFTNEGLDGTEYLARAKADFGLQQYADADQLITAMAEKYDLMSYSPAWRRKLAAVRYRMTLYGFSDATLYSLATDVPFEAVAVLKENSARLPGVQISETTARTYPDGTLLPTVLGTVGKITADQWAAGDHALRSAGYAMNEWIGQSGLESLYESTLRGKDGRLVLSRDAAGNITDSTVTVTPEPGKTLQLTINARLQQAVSRDLAEAIETLQTTKAPGAGAECCGGAVVVLDTSTGGILAMASAPTYDLTRYTEQYDLYANDPAQPLFDRALQGLYAPGSTFKPALAVAAVDGGIITPADTVTCTGTYTYYSDYQPHCLQISHSGPISLIPALTYSCNCYFYDVGRRTGLERTDHIARALGLGADIGLELPTAEGRLTTESDDNYSDGLVLQASIGQGNTAVTPVQLATYAATLANHGVRYQTHLLAGIRDGTTGQLTDHYQSMVLSIVDSDEAFDLVEQGMLGVTGTLSALRSLPFTVACKTGSPQRSETYDTPSGPVTYANTVLIAYGPVPDPTVAVAIVLDYGGGGSNGAPLLASVLKDYSQIIQ